jgi:YD repeat-containing protein
MITGEQPKILLTQDENGNLKMDDEQAKLLFGDPKKNWKLVRERDGLTNESAEVMWLEWNKEGKFKAKHDKPAIGRSLIMSPFNRFFTWQTTVITEIVEEREDYVKFHTENSTYELWKLS